MGIPQIEILESHIEAIADELREFVERVRKLSTGHAAGPVMESSQNFLSNVHESLVELNARMPDEITPDQDMSDTDKVMRVLRGGDIDGTK